MANKLAYIIKMKIKTKIKKRITSTGLAIAFVFVSVGIGFLIGQTKVECEICPPQELDFSLFWEVYYELKDKFVEPGKIDEQKIIYGAISGMVESLGDPYTVFMEPDDTKKFMEDIAGSFEGVGMEIGIREDVLQVIAPLEGTPAQKAGLRAGDRVVLIDGKSTLGVSLDEAVTLIRGPKGTSVILTIIRKEWKSVKDIEVTRGVIKVPSLRWEMISSDKTNGEQGIAYIKIYHFSEKAGADFAQAAIEILSSDAKKIILDLRNNPGGYLEIARDIASFFMEKGSVVVIEDFGERQTEYKANGNNIFLQYPVVVLINQGSASASEILAGALRDNQGILLVGETSFGKGSVQQLEKLRGESSLKITIAKWLTPSGKVINDIGLEPDVESEFTQEDYEQEKDPQLDKAIEIIKDL